MPLSAGAFMIKVNIDRTLNKMLCNHYSKFGGGIWEESLMSEYGIRIVDLDDGRNFAAEFPSEDDYIMFVLKYS